MTDEQVAQKIRTDLRNRFPGTVFQVSYVNGDLDLQRVGGDNGKQEFSSMADAVSVIESVIRKTIPNFSVSDYE